MDGTQYLPTVAWSFNVRNVILLTSPTVENPATFRCTANPFDSSEPGANTTDKEIGYFVTDNVGNIYSVIGTGTHTVDLSDDFRSGVGPQTGKWAVISKSAGNGTAPFLTPIHYRRLDKSAIDNVRRIELDVLWKHRLFTYVAYASDNIGTDFTLDATSKLPYEAKLISPIEIATPTVGDFAGLWRSSGGTQIQTDWNQATNTQPDYIKNKPTIPDAQIQSDWTQTNNTLKDYIKNKPSAIASAPTTVSSSSANSDNRTNHTHALDDVVTAKTVNFATITIDAKGRVTAASSGSPQDSRLIYYDTTFGSVSNYQAAQVLAYLGNSVFGTFSARVRDSSGGHVGFIEGMFDFKGTRTPRGVVYVTLNTASSIVPTVEMIETGTITQLAFYNNMLNPGYTLRASIIVYN